jgi:prepilin-type N-terminal cleavage/methylation domain-containing protein
MRRRLGRDDRGFTLAEMVVASAIGAIALLGMFTLYRSTTTAFNLSSSQAALQRTGTLALESIQRQGLRASTIAVAAAPGCAPAGTTGRALQITVTDTTPSTLAAEAGDYCYYAGLGTATNGAAAGALCQRFRPTGSVTWGSCRDLIGGPVGGLVRETGQRGVTLFTQPGAADTRCPNHSTNTSGNPVSGGTAIAAGQRCLALGQVAGNMGEIAFALTDGRNIMTFSGSLALRN